MKLKASDIFSRMIDNVIAHPRIYVAVALLLTVLSAIVIATKFDIKSEINVLMPQDSQVVEDLMKISDRMGSISTLTVYIKTPSLEPLSETGRNLEEYSRCLAMLGDGEHLLRPEPPVGENWCDNALILYSMRFVEIARSLESVGYVAFHNDKSFFENNLLLYASNEELEQAYEQIDDALTEARRQSGEYKACLIAADSESECDDLKPGLAKNAQGELEENGGDSVVDDFKSKLLDKYKATELASVREFPLYAIENGGWMVPFDIRFKKSTTGLKEVRREMEKISKLLEDIDISLYDPRIEIEYGGGLNDMKSEYNAIITDIVRSISFTILSILALIALFFRSLRAPCRIFGPLLMSTIWAVALTFLAIGFLNLITAFIFAILIGLGIDFGIHLYARFIHERKHGKDVENAIRTSVIETGTPLFFGALTTAAAFYTLTFGSFPGFSQFGFVAGTGVLFSFMTMTTVMPACVIIMERIWPSKIRNQGKYQTVSGSMAKKLYIPMIAASLIGIGCAAHSATQIPELQFEDNFNNLNMKKVVLPPGQKKVVPLKKFITTKRPSSPTVAILENFEQVETLEMLLKVNREYENFQHFRKLAYKGLPEFMRFVDSTFAEVLPIMDANRAIPMLSAISRMLPPDSDFMNYIPMFVTYSREKSESLKLYRNGVQKLPQTMQWMSLTFGEVLEKNTVANALPVVARMTQTLPEWLWAAIPTQRSTQQLNTISDFASIFSYLPGTREQQLEKLQTIQKIRERTADRQIRFLPENEKKQIQDFRKYLVENALGVDDLPEWVKQQFKESGTHPLPPRPESGVDYSFGNIVLLYQNTYTYMGNQAAELVHDTRSIRVDGKRVVAASGAFVYADMLDLVKTDGLRIAMIALLVILLIAIIQKRNPVSAIIVTLPVLSGLAFSMALMVFMDSKLNLFNIVMLPVTLGIGIDGAIYLLERYQSLGRGSCVEAVRAVIGPVFMSSSTTLVGFGGMLLSGHMGLNSMGELAIIGISSCFVATFLVQPGLILAAEKLGLKGTIPDHEFQPESENSPEPEEHPEAA